MANKRVRPPLGLYSTGATAAKTLPTPKLQCIFQASEWDAKWQWGEIFSRRLHTGEDGGGQRAEFLQMPESFIALADAAHARFAVMMRRSPGERTDEELDLFDLRKPSHPSRPKSGFRHDLDGEFRYANTSLPISEEALRAFIDDDDSFTLKPEQSGFAPTYGGHFDVTPLFETGSHIMVATLQGSAKITVRVKLKCKTHEFDGENDITFHQGPGDVYLIHMDVWHSVCASFDRVAIVYRPKTWLLPSYTPSRSV